MGIGGDVMLSAASDLPASLTGADGAAVTSYPIYVCCELDELQVMTLQNWQPYPLFVQLASRGSGGDGGAPPQALTDRRTIVYSGSFAIRRPSACRPIGGSHRAA